MALYSKRSLVREVAKETGLPYVQVDFVYESLLSVLRDKVEEGYDFNFKGLARLFHIDSPAGGRKSYLTGGIMPHHKLLKAKPNAELRRIVNLKTRV